jgi:hypothetical protein
MFFLSEAILVVRLRKARVILSEAKNPSFNGGWREERFFVAPLLRMTAPGGWRMVSFCAKRSLLDRLCRAHVILGEAILVVPLA